MQNQADARRPGWLLGFTPAEAVFIVVCGLAFAAFRLFVRLRIGLPGHSMVVFVFFLVGVRLLVGRFGSATLCALVAGLALAAIGAGKAGPIVFFQTLLPGLVLDLAGLLGLFRLPALIMAPLAGVLSGLARAPGQLAGNLLVGMEPTVAFAAVGVRILPAIAFSTLGALLAAWVARRFITIWGAQVPDSFQPVARAEPPTEDSS